MTIKSEDGTGFSVVYLDKEDLQNLPEVTPLPKPEPLPDDVLQKIHAAKLTLKGSLETTKLPQAAS